MTDRASLFAHARRTYGIDPDYPFAKHPTHGVLRHRGSRKWFALVMTVKRESLGLDGQGMVDIVNLKCDPHKVQLIRTDAGVLPAYHMNREHWLSVMLDCQMSSAQVLSLVDESYGLTGGLSRTIPYEDEKR